MTSQLFLCLLKMLVTILYRKRYSIALVILGVYGFVLLSSIKIIELSTMDKQTCPYPQDCNKERSDPFQRNNIIPQPEEIIDVRKASSLAAGTSLERADGSPSVKKNDAVVVEEVNTNNENRKGDVIREVENIGQDNVRKVSDEKIDWNDYAAMDNDSKRVGLGEQGKAFVVQLSDQESKLKEKLFEEYKYNAYFSDIISLERSIGDLRTESCKKQKFLKDIPENSTSFIIVFHNERNSTLLRTITSIVNRSPAKLVREIILVDDMSTNVELKSPLDEYVGKHFPKVAIIRNQQRQGLIRSRMIGSTASSGRFLVFLDAHVEVNHNYLPPLLEPMVQNYRTVSCPMVDNTRAQSLHIYVLESRVRGGFDWDLSYKRLPVAEMDEVTPHPSPVMVGCAFAITRKWWEELGMYDSGLEIWGAEQYELSFKSWQCGGSVVDAPCSRVAHLFRALPYTSDINDDVFEKNLLRIASVWMDEYKDIVVKRRPRMSAVNVGNLTQQLAIRKRLNCKPFKWFMEEVAPDIIKYYPLIEPPMMAWGQIRNKINSSLCVTTNQERSILLGACSSESSTYFKFDWRLRIRQRNREGSRVCFGHTGDTSIFMWDCFDIEKKPTQNFVWNLQSGHVVSTRTNLCLDVNMSTLILNMKPCDSNSQTQSWVFENYNATIIDVAWQNFAKNIQ